MAEGNKRGSRSLTGKSRGERHEFEEGYRSNDKEIGGYIMAPSTNQYVTVLTT